MCKLIWQLNLENTNKYIALQRFSYRFPTLLLPTPINHHEKPPKDRPQIGRYTIKKASTSWWKYRIKCKSTAHMTRTWSETKARHMKGARAPNMRDMEVDGSMKRKWNERCGYLLRSSHMHVPYSIGSHIRDFQISGNDWARFRIAGFIGQKCFDLAFCDFALLNRLCYILFVFCPWLHLKLLHTKVKTFLWPKYKSNEPDENNAKARLSCLVMFGHQQCQWSCHAVHDLALRIWLSFFAPRQGIYLDLAGCANWIHKDIGNPWQPLWVCCQESNHGPSAPSPAHDTCCIHRTSCSVSVALRPQMEIPATSWGAETWLPWLLGLDGNR